MASDDPNDPYRFVDNPPTPQYGGGFDGNTTAGGNATLDLNFVDYSSLVAPFVNFQNAFNFAQGVGRQNANTYYKNLTSDRTKNAALSFVDTDIQGINRGLDALIPRARSEGNQDTEFNIARAGRIDQFNQSRLPGFQQFNQKQVEQNNQFNRAEREKSIQAAGIDYRSRIGKVLNQLSTQSEGRMSDPLLDTLITSTNRNRGADIGAASGINSLSGAGINIQDKLDVNQRIGLALDAQKTLPGVLGNAQGILQPPEEMLPTQLSLPTNVPLNATNLGERIPIQSNISAGAAQQNVGTAATNIETIPAPQALSARLNTDQYNATGKYERDVKVLDSTQGQLTAQDSENLRGILQDKEDSRQQQSLDAYYAGLDQRSSEANTRAISGVAGSVGGAIVSNLPAIGDFLFGGGGGGNEQQGGGQQGGGGSGGGFFETVANGARDLFSNVFGGGDGSSDAATGSGQKADGGNTGDYQLPSASITPGSVSEGLRGPQFSLDGSGGNPGPALEFFSKTASPTVNDAPIALRSASIATRLPEMSTPQQVQAIGNMGVDVAVSRNLIPREEARQINTAVNNLGTLVNPDATDVQRATAAGTLGASIRGTPFQGSVNAPTSIGGQSVIGQSVMGDGSPGFQLADGSTVARADLAASANGLSTLNAAGVLTSKAPFETKVAALTSIGLDAGRANDIVTQVNAGNGMAALSLFNTAKNFDQMNPVEKAANFVQTGNAIHSAISGSSAATAAPVNTGASVFGATLPGGASLGGITAGAYTGYNQYTGVNKFLSGDTDKLNPVERAALFTTTGGLSAIAGLEGFGGSGKSTGRQLRDSWRAGMKSNGIIDDKYNVTLADGTKYDIGKDDGAKLVNAQGRERNTFDIDWGDKVATNSIPDAHIFAIATGLDPTDSAKADTFHRAVSQSVNAATSNAKTPAEVRDNYRAMMKDVDPGALGARIETLRQTGKINEKDYGIYLDHMNKMFGTDFKPQNKQKAKNTIVSHLRGSKVKHAKDLLRRIV